MRRPFRINAWLALVFLAGLLAACATGGENTPSAPAQMPTEQVAQAELPTPTQQVEQPAPTAASTETQLAQPTGTQAEASPNATVESTLPGAGTAVPTDSVTVFPDPAGYAWVPVISQLNKPLDLLSPPDGSGRLFILEQPGAIRIVRDGGMLPEAFLDIRNRVGSRGNEQGLLGMAFHPEYASNGFFYLNYTDLNGDSVIARYSVTGNADQADPGSELVLLQVDQPYPNHNGGGMMFGPDGYLYISLGDGGSAGDPQGNAQSLNTLLGKLLRIDINGGEPYVIPADNPFPGGPAPEIWAYGLRNPWRFSFDRLTGDLYIADVGQNMWEEIDFLAAGSPGGANFGWDYLEGNHPFEGQPPADAQLVPPVYEYQHGVGCSVTGGYVYRGQALPAFRGIYLFSDFCTGRVWGLLRGADGAFQAQELFQTGFNVTSFGLDQDGEIYLLDQSSGTVHRLEQQ